MFKTHNKFTLLAVETERATELYVHYNLLVNPKHHKVCKSCDKIPLKKWFKTLESTKASCEISQQVELFLTTIKKELKKTVTVEQTQKSKPTSKFITPFYKTLAPNHTKQLIGLTPTNFKQLCKDIQLSPMITWRFLFLCRHSLSFRSVASIYVRVVLDGTYFYCQKSSNFKAQKHSYSGYKERNLVKSMGVVCPNGKFWGFSQMYYSNGQHSDDVLLQEIMIENTMKLITNFLPGINEFMADRGFKNEYKGFKVHKPLSIKGNEKQLSREQANTTRMVTRLRFVVEAAFGRLKQWKILKHTIDTNLLPSLHFLVCKKT